MNNRKYFNRYPLKNKYWMILWFEIGKEIERANQEAKMVNSL